MKNQIIALFHPSSALFIGVLLLGTLAIYSCHSPASTDSTRQSPNILWIIAEDLSPDLGCYGHSIVKTPNIDALATKGVRFTQVFTTAPVCSPSRTALAVGMYQTAINAHDHVLPRRLGLARPSSSWYNR